MIKLSDYVIQFVADLGVKHLFLIPGGGCMHLVDSVGRCPGLTYVCNLHEQGCAIAADAYGQYTNNLGAALVTTGPGGTNAITGVAAAWLDSTPCLFLSGQVKRPDLKGDRGVRQLGFQEIDIVKIVDSITKYAVTVSDPASIRYHMEKAGALAKHGRPGPVWVDIPLDVQAANIEPGELRGFSRAELPVVGEPGALAGQVAATIELLNKAERPVILVGNGVRLADGLAEFEELVELLHVPILTTWKALDFLPDEHPCYAGRPGAVGQRGANFTQQNSDFILILGARMDFGQTAYNHAAFARAAAKVMVDVDAAEIRKMEMKIDVPVIADAKAFLRELLRQRGKIAPQAAWGAWLSRSKALQTKYPLTLPDYFQEKGVNNYVLIDALSHEMIDGDLLVPGSSGACSENTMQAFRSKKGIRVFNSEGLGPMGFGIAAAIGGCLASGRRRTVCVDGDGGFIMNIQELEVIKRLGLPIKFFVLVNDGYASIRSTQRTYFQDRRVASDTASGLSLPDLARVAASFGISTASIDAADGIRGQVRKILDAQGPVVCTVQVSPLQGTAPRVSSRQREDGSMVSTPMEDLFPYLDRDEFARQMLIPPLGSLQV